MKKIVFGAVALLIITQLASTYYLKRRFQLQACPLMYSVCQRGCDAALRDTLNANNLDRGIARIAHQQALIECNVQNIGNTTAQQQCRQEETRAFDDLMARIDASDVAARERHERCVAQCRTENDACQASNAAVSDGNITAAVDVVGTVTDDCIPGGPPCFKPVSDFCQHASGPCDECTLSFCGGGEWMIETDGNQLPSSTTLVAATDPLKNPRVLATSTTRGNQAVLNVPPNIKLGAGEQLYFGFSSAKKAGGPVQLRFRRSK
jgi:hypothetical protein